MAAARCLRASLLAPTKETVEAVVAIAPGRRREGGSGESGRDEGGVDKEEEPFLPLFAAAGFIEDG